MGLAAAAIIGDLKQLAKQASEGVRSTQKCFRDRTGERFATHPKVLMLRGRHSIETS